LRTQSRQLGSASFPPTFLLLIFFCALKSTTAEAHEIAPFISHNPFLRWVNVGFGPQGAPEAIGIFAMITGLLLAAGNGAFAEQRAWASSPR
jgi:hypothetical protein